MDAFCTSKTASYMSRRIGQKLPPLGNVRVMSAVYPRYSAPASTRIKSSAAARASLRS
jgi:hypothetical protein